jgi:L-arabinose isomerase
MMNELGRPKIGLLPLTLEMYNEYSPEVIQKQGPFVTRVAKDLGSFSEVHAAPICAKRMEIGKAVADLEAKGIDLLVVIFVTYATSISALKPLLDTNLPLLLYSTTPKSSMAEGMTMEDIMLNHGVHGYMDLANVLRRNDRPFFFVCGKIGDGDALRDIESYARVARVKRMLKQATIGIAGYTFDGMGDFGVDTTVLNAELGPETRHVPLNVLSESVRGVTEKEVTAEIERDKTLYAVDPGVGGDIHRESNRLYLGLSKIVKDLSLNAFTMHFQGMLENPEIRTLPFLGISKLQKEGLAYAGEGDLLGATAGLMVRCLCGNTLFTETFCPDFEGGRLVMGHMGESNPDFGVTTLLRRKKFVFGKALDPVVADVSMKEQAATVLNLGIVEDGRFQMVVYSGTICKKIGGSPDIDMPYFHFKPDMPLTDFLTEYSLAGGTHHVSITAGDRAEDLLKLAEAFGIQIIMMT